MSALRILFIAVTVLGAMAGLSFWALYASGIAGAATNIALMLAVFFSFCTVAAAIAWKKSTSRRAATVIER